MKSSNDPYRELHTSSYVYNIYIGMYIQQKIIQNIIYKIKPCNKK